MRLSNFLILANESTVVITSSIHVYVGAAEYSASYASKQDEADVKQLRNMVVKKFAQLSLISDDSMTSKIRAVAKSILACYKVGTVQACYKLLGLKHVISSRACLSIRSVKRSLVHQNIILQSSEDGEMEDGAPRMASRDNVIGNGIGTQLGIRDAYARLVAQQRSIHSSNKVEITLWQMCTAFSLVNDTKANRGIKKIEAPPFFVLCPTTGTWSVLISLCVVLPTITLFIPHFVRVGAERYEVCYCRSFCYDSKKS